MNVLERTTTVGPAGSRPPLRVAAESFDVAIIGGGFAGTLVAVQLVRLSPHPLRIVIFDRADAFGRGAAYSAVSDSCLLNVRAKSMGAFPDAQGDFLVWLRETGYANGASDLGERFLPRRLYGDYLCALLDRCIAHGGIIEQRPACVTELTPHENEYVVSTSCPRQIFAKSVVLALGNLPPGGFGNVALTAAVAQHARNPWELLAEDAIERDANVFIIGTGLSALDIMLHLDANGHRGRITMLSRHGRFPLAHADDDESMCPPVLPNLNGSPGQVLRALRSYVSDAVNDGCSWQAVIDALRPQTNRIWSTWTLDEQRRFHRHLAAMWGVHRHRAPASTLAVLDTLVADGRLDVQRGRLVSVAAAHGDYSLRYADHETQTERSVRADIIINCTGPRRDIANSEEALIEAIFARGLGQADALGLGFAAASDGMLLGAELPSPLYALGTPLRGTLCESSAVREIRAQALTVAESIVAANRLRNKTGVARSDRRADSLA